MEPKNLQKTGETKPKRNSPKRPGQQPQTEPGDNKRYIQHTMEIVNLKRIDLKSSDQVEKRLMEYFTICERNDMKPSVAGLALALGIDRTTLWKIRTNQEGSYSPEVRNTLKRGVTVINAMMEDYMQNGKINPVSGIFLMKNNMDYTDKQEVVVTPNNQLGETQTAEQLAERYRDSVVVDTDGEEVDQP